MRVLRIISALAVLLSVARAAGAEAVCAPDDASSVLSTLADVDGDRTVEGVEFDVATSAGPSLRPAPCAGDVSTAIARVRFGALHARDVDDDSDVDLVHVDAAGALLRVWLNDGTGQFTVVVPVRGRSRVSDAPEDPTGRLQPAFERRGLHRQREACEIHDARLVLDVPTIAPAGCGSLSPCVSRTRSCSPRGPPSQRLG